MIASLSLRRLLTAACSWVIFATSAPANVLGLFPGGADAKSAGMETAVDSREPQTLLYNPAALSLSRPGFQGELGVGRLLYSYEHPRFDPVKVSLFSPVMSEGWRNQRESQIAWGFAVLPTSVADLKLRGLPRRLEGKTDSLDVHSVRKQFHLALGGAWTPPSCSQTHIGASLLMTYDQRTLTAESLIDGARLLEMSSKGTFYRPIMGVFHTQGPVDFGIAYMAKLVKKYKGETTVASTTRDTDQVDVDPAVWSNGVRYSQDVWTASVNVNRVFGAGGKDEIRDGVGRAVTADVRDVNQYGTRLGYSLNPNHAFSAAYTYLPTIWGAGSYAVDKDGFGQHELGHLFGVFNAMPVHNQSLAWRYTGTDWTFHNALFRSSGQQSVDGGGDNPGYYQIEFVSITSGIARAL